MEKSKKSRHEELQLQLVSELKSLRAAVRETAGGFILCKESEIETMLDYLLKIPPGKLKTVARSWIRETRALKIKPAKGRIKDLKKIDTLLNELHNYAIEAEDQEQKLKAPRKNHVIKSSNKKVTSPEKASS